MAARMTTERLIERCRRGEQLAWDALYVRFGRMIRGVASEYFVPDGDREDLIQEGRMGLLSAVNSWRAERGMPFDSFAHSVVRRRIITAVKTANRGKHGPLNGSVRFEAPVRAIDSEDASLLDVIEGEGCPSERLALRDELRQILDRIWDPNLLTDLEREALLGVVFNGRSYRELAAERKTVPKRIDNALVRARAKLAA